MATLKVKTVNPDETTHQQVSMKGDMRNILVVLAENNKRSLSSEIMYRVEQALKYEGVLK